MALHVLAYNLTRVMNVMGIQPHMAAIRAWSDLRKCNTSTRDRYQACGYQPVESLYTSSQPTSAAPQPRQIGACENPITGIVGCCARAASGHPATPLPRSAMNSRRLMGLTPRPRITRQVYQVRAVHRSKSG